MSDQRVLDRLISTLQQRAKERPPGSYTTKLLDGGVDKIGAKILEEAQEVVEAAGEPGDKGREHFIYEAGDLIYHLFVMLAWRGVTLEEVESELGRREGTSGLTEKQNRSNKADESDD